MPGWREPSGSAGGQLTSWASGHPLPGMTCPWSAGTRLRSRLNRLPARRGTFLAVLPGQTSGHDGDHGPVHHGFVVLGQAFVVADGAAAEGDRGQGPADGPAAGERAEGG